MINLFQFDCSFTAFSMGDYSREINST